jgi:uncharacterized protein YcfJ
MPQPKPQLSRLALAAALALAPLAADAGHDERRAVGTTYATARVVDVVPVYETVRHAVPTEVCRDERVPYRGADARRSSAAPVLGAIIGGAIGNAVGHEKRNKQVGAVAGAVLGGAIGYDLSRRGGDAAPAGYRYEEVCEVSHQYREEERIAHYEVSYQYGGEVYSTTLPYDPGRNLRVRVSVTPADGHDARGRDDRHAYNRGGTYWR